MANLRPESPDGDVMAVYQEAVRECRTAFAAEGALDRVVDYPFGRVLGRQFLGMYVVDAVVHAWDLARAAQLDERLDPKAVRWILDNFAWIYHGVSESPLTDGHEYYGPPTRASTAAVSDQDRLLRAMGR
jgi:uncharacterized protein (TIGR03086 family)